MENVSVLVQGGAVGISIGLIILIGYIFKNLIPVFKSFNDILNANTVATTEMHEFLKGLNGRLKRAVDDKLSEK